MFARLPPPTVNRLCAWYAPEVAALRLPPQTGMQVEYALARHRGNAEKYGLPIHASVLASADELDGRRSSNDPWIAIDIDPTPANVAFMRAVAQRKKYFILTGPAAADWLVALADVALGFYVERYDPALLDLARRHGVAGLEFGRTT